MRIQIFTGIKSGIEYYIEFHYNNHEDNCKRKYKGTFTKNTICTLGSNQVYKDIITSHFNNITQIQPINIYYIDNMSYTEPETGNYSWTFYQISEPIIYQKSIDRLYENAIHINP